MSYETYVVTSVIGLSMGLAGKFIYDGIKNKKNGNGNGRRGQCVLETNVKGTVDRIEAALNNHNEKSENFRLEINQIMNQTTQINQKFDDQRRELFSMIDKLVQSFDESNKNMQILIMQMQKER